MLLSSILINVSFFEKNLSFKSSCCFCFKHSSETSLRILYYILFRIKGSGRWKIEAEIKEKVGHKQFLQSDILPLYGIFVLHSFRCIVYRNIKRSSKKINDVCVTYSYLLRCQSEKKHENSSKQQLPYLLDERRGRAFNFGFSKRGALSREVLIKYIKKTSKYFQLVSLINQ